MHASHAEREDLFSVRELRIRAALVAMPLAWQIIPRTGVS